jgi:hypothetical protein
MLAVLMLTAPHWLIPESRSKSACMGWTNSTPHVLVPDLCSESERLEACRSTFAGFRLMALRPNNNNNNNQPT